MKNAHGKATTATFVIALALFVVLLFSGGFINLATKRAETLTVSEKWTKRTGESSDLYLVETDRGVYRVADSLWDGSWRAADRWAALDEGDTVCATVTGWRIGVFSGYPKIVKQAEGAC